MKEMNFWYGKRVAVLGGCGMIGSFAVEKLLKLGAEVTVADNLSRGRMTNLNGLDCKFEYADVSRIHNCSCIKGKDVVLNFAAKVTGMHYNRTHHAEMFYENMLLQMIPLKACLMWRVPRYLQCSTVCVYPREMSYPVSEEEGHRGWPEPTNAGYGWAKRMGERYAQWVAQTEDIKIAITRFSNCYGPRDYFNPETSHVIPALIRRALEDDVILVNSTGIETREFLYAEDAAEGALRVIEHYATTDPVNIGTKARVTIRELANIIRNLMEVHEYIPKGKGIIFSTADRQAGYPRRGSDSSKLHRVTGWRPQTGLITGLKRTIDWYLDNTELAERP